VSCRYHLYLEVNEHGHIQLNHPGLEPDELDALPDTCALDVAERGPATLADVGQVLDRSPERVRQIESDALGRLARLAQPSSDPRLCPDAEILRELLDQEKPDA
jgi:DNA-directed RNA polymerase sigma subunit (sigma70/sigma32)